MSSLWRRLRAAVTAAALATGVFGYFDRASATDMLPPPPAATPGPAPAQSDWWPLLSSSLYHPERFELRGGVFAHALASPEAGSVDANLELVAPKFS